MDHGFEDNGLLRNLDDTLTSSSTISNPVIRIADEQLYKHLRSEEILAYIHVQRVLECYSSLDREHSRFLEDVQEIFYISEKISLVEKSKVVKDSLIGLIKRHNVPENRDVVEELKKNCQNDVKFQDRELYGLFRQEELLAYHHMVKAISANSNPKRAHVRLLEDVVDLFRICSTRVELEKQMAESDPVLLLIRTHRISSKRKTFDGRILDDSFTQATTSEVDHEMEDLYSPKISANEQDLSSSVESAEKDVDMMYERLLRKQEACKKNEMNTTDFLQFLDEELTKLAFWKTKLSSPSSDDMPSYQ